MRYSDGFGKTSSKILLGTTYFGDTISEKLAFDIMDKYYELGGNHIDTARSYAKGEAERVVARWLKSRKPENVLVSTKGGFPETPNVSRISEKEIRHDIETSLKALETECIEFYWLHRDDENIPAGEIIEIMNGLVKEGKIKRFGASNWTTDRIDAANEYAERQKTDGFAASQIRFSPAVIAPGGDADRSLVDMDEKSFDYYRKKKMPVAAFASQAKGFFSKMAKDEENGLSEKSKNRYLCRENLDRLEIIKELAEKYKCSVAAIVCGAMCSLAYPSVFPIIGGSNVSQIADSMSGADITVEKDELEHIFEI